MRKLNRYKVNLGLHISAHNKEEAYELIKKILNDGTTTSKDGRWIGKIVLPDYDSKSVEKLPF